MANSTIGHIEPFNKEIENWDSYAERFDHYLLANDVKDEKKIVSVFLTIMGSKTYELLRNLVAPGKPADLKYQELVEILGKHFNPAPLLIAERFHFHTRNQNEGEGVADYAAALKKYAERCKFDSFLEQALRDRFVCGLKNRAIQKKLLTEKDLTWKLAVDIAHAMESADKQANALRSEGNSSAVHKLEERKHRQPRQNRQRTYDQDSKPCFRCGENHSPQSCRFKDQHCRFCKKQGHIERVCKKKKAGGKPRNHDRDPVRYVENEKESTDFGGLFHVHESNPEPSIVIPVQINGTKVSMELDTGASVSVMSESTWKEKFSQYKLQPSSVQLKTYSGENLNVLGQLQVNVECNDQRSKLPIQIVEGRGPMLLGRNWLKTIKLNWGTIKKVTNDLDQVLHNHNEVFKDELGTMKDTNAKLYVKPNCNPKFCKPRSVPHALKEGIEQELTRLENLGVLEKVRYSEWAAPIVPVVKPDKSIRICGDYKVTVNSALEVDQHPLPNPEQLFVELSEGEKFTKLDLSRAYQQILLDENSREYVTINTHKGLYRPTRLPFGVASASAIFQSKIEQVLQGIPMVVCRVDDILISGKHDQDHLKNLNEVLARLKQAGLRLKMEKCKFMKPSVEYLGYRVDMHGLHAIEKKVEAIKNAPAPENQQQLRSFLGMVNYYAKFVSNYSTVVHPLNELLRHNVKWKWTPKENDAFCELKKKLGAAPILTHFRADLPLKLDTDASNYGIGAVISHIMPNGSERPIAFASRTLSKSERNYAQIEKEALSIIFGVKKFHEYLYGRKFLLVTDHKPLLSLLGPKSGIPTLAAARMQRWALILAAYQYDIEYRATAKHANADCMSRLPLKNDNHLSTHDEVKQVNQLQFDSLPINVEQIRKATRHDPLLARILEYTMSEWPIEPTEAEKLYFHKRFEITTEDGCLLWGMRVIIPKQFRARILEELHTGHPGIVRMKSLARFHVWWPGLDKDIADNVHGCVPCQSVRNKPAQAPLQPWQWPKRPWQRIHVDFAGPFMNKMFFLVVDSQSKWLEVEIMPSTTSNATIEKLRDMFARYGLPEQLVSDNGPQFISNEFSQFMKLNGIKHSLVAPYHPRSNGQAERFVQTFKQYFKAEGTQNIKQNLARFLFSYRTTPNSTTGQTPAEIFLNRRPKTRLDLLRPDLGRRVESKQNNQKVAHDAHSKNREFQVDEKVLVQNFRGEPKWLEATVVERTGPVSYKVMIGEETSRRHVDQMLSHKGKSITHSKVINDSNEDYMSSLGSKQVSTEVTQTNDGPPCRTPSTNTEVNTNSESQPRYPMRVRQPPNRLTY